MLILSKTKGGKSIDLDDYEKVYPADFALLKKRASLGELKGGIYHKTKWGNVKLRLGLACAAISQKYLGTVYDIHISGTYEAFPPLCYILAINKAFSGHGGVKISLTLSWY